MMCMRCGMGRFLVWDFDGTNQRNLAESVRSEKEPFGCDGAGRVMVRPNNRWMYYLTEDKTGIELVREKIRGLAPEETPDVFLKKEGFVGWHFRG